MSDYTPGMTTEPFIPHADSIKTAWVIMCQQSRIATQPPVEELEAEFDRFIARAKAEAWDEGYWQGGNDVGSGLRENELTPNPYLKGQDNE